MKKILIILSFLVCFVFKINAQGVPPLKMGARMNITNVSGSDPYTLTGVIQDDLSLWGAGDINTTLDSIYHLEGSDILVYRITGITSAAGNNFVITVDDINDTGILPSTGTEWAIVEFTDNYQFPYWIGNLASTLNFGIQNRFVQRLDAIINSVSGGAAGKYSYVTTDSFSTFLPQAPVTDSALVWRTTTGAWYQKIGSNYTRRSYENGQLASTIFNQSNDTLLFNANLNNRAQMSHPNYGTTGYISAPTNIATQSVGEIFQIGIQNSNDSLITVSWNDVFGQFGGDAMPDVMLTPGTTINYLFQAVADGLEGIILRSLNDFGGGGSVDSLAAIDSVSFAYYDNQGNALDTITLSGNAADSIKSVTWNGIILQIVTTAATFNIPVANVVASTGAPGAGPSTGQYFFINNTANELYWNDAGSWVKLTGVHVPILDAGNYYTTDNTEAAFQQIAATNNVVVSSANNRLGLEVLPGVGLAPDTVGLNRLAMLAGQPLNPTDKLFGYDEATSTNAMFTAQNVIDLVQDSVAGMADGNGIYSGSGSVPTNTIATIDNEFNFRTTPIGYATYDWGYDNFVGDMGDFLGYQKDANNYFGAGYNSAGNEDWGLLGYVTNAAATKSNTLVLEPGVSSMRGTYKVGVNPELTGDIGITNGKVLLQQTLSGILEFDSLVTFEDTRGTTRGIEYLADYSAGIKPNARSIPDVGIVRSMIGDSVNIANIDNLTDGKSNTTSTVYLGTGAGAAGSPGTESVGVGINSLNASTGANNTAIGHRAGAANTTQTDNTYIGKDAGRLATSSNNTVVGSQAFDAATTAWGNVAIGAHALGSNTVGDNNTAIGDSTLFSNTSGINNTAVGYQSMTFNTTGESNTAVGTGALTLNTIGNQNTGVGKNSLLFNTTGGNNTAGGNGSLASNTTGNDNTALGHGALGQNSTANDNTAVGSNALALNTTGTTNTAIGRQAMTANTTGSNNTSGGYQALTLNTTGSENTAFGTNALRANSTGRDNVAIGAHAGRSFTTGTGNTVVGDSAYNVSTNYNNVIVLGKGAQPTVSNQAVVGNTSVDELKVGNLIWKHGTGSPEGVVTAPVGSYYSRTNGGANTTLYVKETGAGNTGWSVVNPNSWLVGGNSATGYNKFGTTGNASINFISNNTFAGRLDSLGHWHFGPTLYTGTSTWHSFSNSSLSNGVKINASTGGSAYLLLSDSPNDGTWRSYLQWDNSNSRTTLGSVGATPIRIAPGGTVSLVVEGDNDVVVGTGTGNFDFDVQVATQFEKAVYDSTGSSGTLGKVFTSNGNGAAPTWQPTPVVYLSSIVNDTVDVQPELQAAIDAMCTAGGGTIVLPEGDFGIANTVTVNCSNVNIVGQGGGFIRATISNIKLSAATRLFWTGSTGGTMMMFTSPTGGEGLSGGGMKGVMLDGNNFSAGTGLEIRSRRFAIFEDCSFWACSDEQVLTGVVDYALTSPADVQHNTFRNCLASTFGGSGTYLTSEAKGWRLTGGSSFHNANTSFNSFNNCFAYMSKGVGFYLEATDNNIFTACRSYAAYDLTVPGMVLGSSDEDSGPLGAWSGGNSVFGAEMEVLCKASQTGGTSSHDNMFFGYSRENGFAQIVFETGAGGAADATGHVFDGEGQIFLGGKLALTVPNATAIANDYYAGADGAWHPASPVVNLTSITSDTVNIQPELQAAIDSLCTAGGGTIVLPEGDFGIDTTVSVYCSNIKIVGQGGGFIRNGISNIRGSAATRLFWTGDTLGVMVKFYSPSGGQNQTGGGMKGIMLDGFGFEAGTCLEIRTFRNTKFEDCVFYAAAQEQVLMGVTSYAMSQGPKDCQNNHFQDCVASSFGGSGLYLTTTAKGWRVTGDSTANTSFTYWMNCLAYMSKGNGFYFENSNNNTVMGCRSLAAYDGTVPGIVMCSDDEDSGAFTNNSPARHNYVTSSEMEAKCEASQTGQESSYNNIFLGYSRGNLATQVVFETGAGGSTDATGQVYDTEGNVMLGGKLVLTVPDATDISNDYYAGADGDWHDPTAVVNTNSWNIGGNNITGYRKFGTIGNSSVNFISNNTLGGRLDSLGHWHFGPMLPTVSSTWHSFSNSSLSNAVKVNASVGGSAYLLLSDSPSDGSWDSYLQWDNSNNRTTLGSVGATAIRIAPGGTVSLVAESDNDVVIGTGTGNFDFDVQVAAQFEKAMYDSTGTSGTLNQIWTSNGNATAPTWKTLTAGDNTFYSTDDNFATLSPATTPVTGDRGFDKRTGGIRHYNGSNWSTKIAQDNGNLATIVVTDSSTPFTFDADTHNRTYFQPSGTAVDSVGPITDEGNQDPGEIFLICFENLTGSSDTITGWHSDYILTDGSQPVDVVLANGAYKCFEFIVEVTTTGTVKFVYKGSGLSVAGGSGDLLNGGNTGAVVVGSNNSTLALESNGTTGLSMNTSQEIGIGTAATAGIKLRTGGQTRTDGKILSAGTGNSPGSGASQVGFLNTNGSSTHDFILKDDGKMYEISNTGKTIEHTDATGYMPVVLKGSATLDFPETTANSSSDLTITVTGAADGDPVFLGATNVTMPADGGYFAWVSAADTVTVRFMNYTTGAVNPDSGTFKVHVSK